MFKLEKVFRHSGKQRKTEVETNMHSVIMKTENVEKKKTDNTGKNKHPNFMFSFQYLILNENKTLKLKISVIFTIVSKKKKNQHISTGI